MHSFDPNIAQRVGVNAAVIYQNFLFWCEKNKANKRHIRDGYVWTYNSTRALSELFPYLTQSQIKTAMSKLVDKGLIVKGEYNLASYDRTSWYSPKVTSEWLSPIGQKSPMEQPEIANGLAENRQPIPDSKPDNKPDDVYKGSPEPSLTINKPSVSKGDIVHQHLIAWAGASAVRSFIEYRRKMRKPLTETAAMRQAEQLKKIFQAGGDTDDALGMAEEKGWRSIQADWYFNAKGKRDGQSNYGGQSPQGRDNGSDPALEQIARLAGLR